MVYTNAEVDRILAAWIERVDAQKRTIDDLRRQQKELTRERDSLSESVRTMARKLEEYKAIIEHQAARGKPNADEILRSWDEIRTLRAAFDTACQVIQELGAEIRARTLGEEEWKTVLSVKTQRLEEENIRLKDKVRDLGRYAHGLEQERNAAEVSVSQTWDWYRDMFEQLMKAQRTVQKAKDALNEVDTRQENREAPVRQVPGIPDKGDKDWYPRQRPGESTAGVLETEKAQTFIR